MSMDIIICVICLRTDRNLKPIGEELSGFHRELSSFSVESYAGLIQNCHYCFECIHLLRKAYKFKEKCRKSTDILNDWVKCKSTDKRPIGELSSLLTDSVSFWTSNNTHIYSYIHEDVVSVEPESSVNAQSAHIVIEPSLYEGNIDSQDVSGDVVTKDLIKLETDEIQNNVNEDSTKYIKDYLVFKDENTTFEDILFENTNTKDDEKINNNDLDNIFNDAGFSDEDDDKLIILKNKLTNNNKVKRKGRKRSYSSSDSEENVKVRRKNLKREKDNVKKKNKDNVKKNRHSKDNAKNNENKKENAQNNVVKGDNKRMRFHSRKGLNAELMNMLNSENSEIELKSRKKLLFNKERLKEELRSKFASCGELKAADGTVIDKEFILQCLDDKVTEFVMKQLYQAVYRKSCIKPKALKLFKCIQNKYRHECESVFEVEYLNTKEKMLEEFENRKTYQSYVTAEFKCEICYQGFKHEKKLHYHKKCHDESAGDKVCGICRVRQRNTKSLINHMNTHEAIYKCKLCPLVTYYKNSMQNHYQQHKGVKYTCKQCNTVFGSNSAFRTHVSYRHARGHVCTACGRAYSTRVGLLSHLTKNHQNAAPASDATAVKCESCALSFASTEAYMRHMRISHTPVVKGRPPGTTDSVCRVRSEGSERRPRRRPVMTCRVCSASGSSWGWLSLHFSLAHPALSLAQVYADKHTHLCDVCGKSFSTLYTLQAHLNVHSGARPFACDSCPASFHRALSLRLHRLVHTPPSKPCATCGKKFRSTSNLYNHMRSHIGDRRYKCEICGKGFIHRCSLNEHVRGVHKNIRRVRKRGVTDATERTH